jgi:hypothetical protein
LRVGRTRVGVSVVSESEVLFVIILLGGDGTKKK